jgi:hypothetical protein
MRCDHRDLDLLPRDGERGRKSRRTCSDDRYIELFIIFHDSSGWSVLQSRSNFLVAYQRRRDDGDTTICHKLSYLFSAFTPSESIR